MGGAFGRLKESDRTLSSVVMEVSAEKAWASLTAGAGRRHTSRRTTGAGTALRGAGESAQSSRKSRGLQPDDTESYTFNELGASLSLPAGPGWVFGRLALGLPSYADTIVSETLGYNFPLTTSVSLSPAATLEQGPRRAVYYSLGVSWRMGGAL